MKTALVSHAAKRKTFAALLAVMLLVILTGCSSRLNRQSRRGQRC